MTPAQLVERVAERAQEIGVGRQHSAIERELEHALCLADRGELPRTIRALEHLLGDVDRVLDDFARIPEAVENRVVGGLPPQRLPVLALPFFLHRAHLAPTQRRPEFLVHRDLVRVGEHALMLPANFGQLVPGRLEELLVRVQHEPIEIELDDRRRTADRRKMSLQIAHARQQRPERPPDPCQRIVRHFNKPPNARSQGSLALRHAH